MEGNQYRRKKNESLVRGEGERYCTDDDDERVSDKMKIERERRNGKKGEQDKQRQKVGKKRTGRKER